MKRPVEERFRDFVQNLVHRIRSLILVLLAIAGFLLTCWGYYLLLPTTDVFRNLLKYHPASGMFFQAFESVYKSVVAFWLQASEVAGSNWQLQVGRVVIALVVVRTGWNFVHVLFRNSLSKKKAGLLRDHTIVCGFGEVGSAAASAAAGLPVVIIEQKDPDLVAIRESPVRKHATIIHGDAQDPAILEAAGIYRAARLVIACGPADENAKIAMIARNMLRGKRRDDNPIKINVHIDDLRLLRRIRDFSLHLSDAMVHTQFFSVAELAAISLVSTVQNLGPGHTYNVLLIGTNAVAESLIIEMSKRDPGAFKAEILDANASIFLEKMKSYVSRSQSHLNSFTPHDVSWESLEHDPERYLPLDCITPDRVIICLPDDSHCLTLAMALDSFFANMGNNSSVRPVISACIFGQSGLGQLIQQTAPERRGSDSPINIEVIDAIAGLKDMPTKLPDHIETLARMVHQDYYEREKLKDKENRTDAFVPWEELNPHEKGSNRAQVTDILFKLARHGLRTDSVGDGTEFMPDEHLIESWAKEEHARWVKWKTDSGWRPGTTTIHAKKIHKDIKPWEDLTEDARNKDRDAVRSIPSLLRKLGLHIIKVKR